MGGTLSPPMGVFGGKSPLNIKKNDNFREVSNCDKSTGLAYFSNDSTIKKRHKMKINTQKISLFD